jgi:hypothetical protein
MLENATAVRDTVARLIADVYAGKVHPKVAAGLAPLMNLELCAIETADLEIRLVKVENLLAKRRQIQNRRASNFEMGDGGYRGDGIPSDPAPDSHEGT